MFFVSKKNNHVQQSQTTYCISNCKSTEGMEVGSHHFDITLYW